MTTIIYLFFKLTLVTNYAYDLPILLILFNLDLLIILQVIWMCRRWY